MEFSCNVFFLHLSDDLWCRPREKHTHTDIRDGVGMMVGNFWAVANWIKQIFIFLSPTYMRAHIHSIETCFKNWIYASSYIAFYHFTCSPFLQSPATNKELFSVFLNCFISLTISPLLLLLLDALLLNIATFVSSGEKKKKTEKCKNCHGKTTSMNKWWHFMTITAIAIDERKKTHKNMNMKKSFTITIRNFFLKIYRKSVWKIFVYSFLSKMLGATKAPTYNVEIIKKIVFYIKNKINFQQIKYFS